MSGQLVSRRVGTGREYSVIFIINQKLMAKKWRAISQGEGGSKRHECSAEHAVTARTHIHDSHSQLTLTLALIVVLIV